MPTEFIEDMPTEFVEDPEATVAEGEIVPEAGSGDYARVWDVLVAARDAETNVRALVIDATRGGLTVDLGIRGFIPKSEIATRNLNGLERFIGQTVEAKVLEADQESGRVVLSQRKVADEKRAAKRVETMAALEKGQILDGVVRRITDFGAFVDIGGIDGLLHISDVAWEQVQNVADHLAVGQKIKVLVLKIEREGERISLGLKQLEEDPWTAVRRDLREGTLVEVEVLRVETAGAVVRVMPSIEGFIPTSEITGRRRDSDNEAPPPNLEVGSTVTVKVLEVRMRERSIIMSLRQAIRDRERNEVRDYMHKQQRDEFTTPTLGDLFGDVFNKLQK